MEILTFLTVLLHFLSSTDAFNVDLSDPYSYYVGKNGYYFGYSLALHRNKARAEKWMVVGAPLGNDTARGKKDLWGALYKCDVSSASGSCTVMKSFDNSTIQTQTSGDTTFIKDQKKGQWFGATVEAAADHIMACAPRYASKGQVGRDHYEHGRCEIHNLKDSDENAVWEPCFVDAELQYGYCEIGLAAKLSSDAKDVLSSAIGVFSGGFTGRLVQSPVSDTNLKRYSDVSQSQKCDYVGYAVTIGNFASDKSRVYVGGAPRADYGKGKVLLFKQIRSNIPAYTTVSSPVPQVGSYFGSSVLALDFNGDGYSDLLVGASYHSWNYNEGAVFAYVNNQRDAMNPIKTPLAGDKVSGAQFGKTMAMADLNQDKFDDAIIGAPYENGGVGAIYLYYGSKDGIRTTYSQKIKPSLLGNNIGSPLRTFSYGVSSGVDIDDNGYPDLAVGSFTTDRAVFLRTRPVITIVGRVVLNVTKISLTSASSVCTAPDLKKYSCLEAKVYFKYQAPSLSFAEISYTLNIDRDRELSKKRGFTFVSGKKVNQLNAQKSVVVNTEPFDRYIIYLVNDTRDIFNPIKVSVSFKYKEPVPCKLCAVMNAFAPKSAEAEAAYVKNCGANDICESDLKLTVVAVIPGGESAIRVGVVDTFSLAVTVENKGENAFATKVGVNMSTELRVVGVSTKQGSNLVPDVKQLTNSINRLVFQVGNPMSPGEKSVFQVLLEIDPDKASTKKLNFVLDVTTISQEIKPADNKATVSIPVKVEADMTISGVVVPGQVVYKDSVLSSSEIGARIRHTLLVQNKGPSSATYSQVSVKFPVKVGNDYFLNLYSLTVEGQGSCGIDKAALNPLKLNIGQRRTNQTGGTNRRKRRDIERITCGPAGIKCEDFQCNIGMLRRGQTVVIRMDSTLVESTFNRVIKDSRDIVMRAVVKPVLVEQPAHNNLPDAVELTLTVNSPKALTRKSTSKVPWWVILLSVLAGVILIAGAVFLLYKRGFFNRKRPEHSKVPTQEDEEL